MKLNIIFICLFFCLFLGTHADENESWNAIDNFRNLEYEMIFESDNILFEAENTEIINAEKRSNLYNSIRNTIKEKRLEAQEKKAQVEREIFSLEKTIARLEGDIIRSRKRIEELNTEVIKTNNQIRGNKKTIELMQQKVKKSEENLKKYIKHIYAKSNTLYKDNEVDNIRAILWVGKIFENFYQIATIKLSFKSARKKCLINTETFCVSSISKRWN